MNHHSITAYRLRSQQLVASGCTTVAEVVGRMGAVQAQEYEQAKWAIGVRLPGSTEASVEEAIRRGEILRTHLLRPTWHFVSAGDIHWLLDLTAPHVSRLLTARKRELDLHDDLIHRSWTVMERALSGHTYLTREGLMEQLHRAGITTDATRAYHLMFYAELAGVVCNGHCQGKKQTYALLRERAPVRRQLSREEALAELATRYFTGHGPATVNDFVWWSGLTVGDARRAIDGAGTYLQAIPIDGKPYWLAAHAEPALSTPSVQLLPAFDEWLIGYADRSASLAADRTAQTVSSNGIFRPVIVVEGQVTGLWKTVRKARSVVIEPTFFQPLPPDRTELVREAVKAYGTYLGRETTITLSP